MRDTESSNQGTRRSLFVRVKKLLGRIRRRFVVDRYDVFTRPVPEDAAFEPPDGYRFAWGGPAELARCEATETELDAEERRLGARRLELGHRLVIGYHGERPVFTMWANPRNLNVPGLVKRRLSADQWFIYKAFTSPAHRGRKLYEKGMHFVLVEMHSLGLRELVGYAHAKKRVSRKGLDRLDFSSAGRLTSVSVPGWQHTFVSRELAERFPEPRSTRTRPDPDRGLER